MTTATQIASQYDRCFASLWRGDGTTVGALETWLRRYWTEGCPLEPAERPDAVSVFGGSGKGIRWFETSTLILGFVPGCRDHCYRVPKSATLPAESDATFVEPQLSVRLIWLQR
jgi:hypothetical protein